MTLGTILLIVLILMLLGAIPTWPHSRSWGYAPSGVLGLVRDHSKTALETACCKAIALNAVSYKNIVHLLGAAKQEHADASQDACVNKPKISHQHLRGPGYFDSDKKISHQTTMTAPEPNHAA